MSPCDNRTFGWRHFRPDGASVSPSWKQPALSRRQVLGGALGATVTIGLARATPSAGTRFLGAARHADGTYLLAGIGALGEPTLRVRLPERGHGPVPSPDFATAIVPSRRPGNWAAVVDLRNGRLVEIIHASRGRHFFGHAVFSPDGGRLYTTENDYDRGRGMVVCRSAHTLEVLGEFDSGGIGPHELKWAGWNTIAVANGGILTHPSQPRRKLNLDSMRPNLSLLRAGDGALIAQATAPDHQASIRHLDIAANGDVVLALQYEGPPTHDIPLLYVFRRATGVIEPLPTPLAVQRRLRQYTASICVDALTGHALVTCPRGHLVTFWDVGGGGYLGHRRIRDAGGVALDAEAREFVVSNGGGSVMRFDAGTFEFRRAATRPFQALSWDNHLAACPPGVAAA